MTKSAENNAEVKQLVRRIEKITGNKFPIPSQWSAKRAKTNIRVMLKLFDSNSCPVCGRKH